jgi:predicted deacetylase
MVSWLSERRRLGDSIAQHGFQHVRPWRPGAARRMLSHPNSLRRGEFVGLDGEETRRALHAGWRLLKLAGIEPDGFVAPAYAYTTVLRRALRAKFGWWADLLRIYAGAPGTGPSRRAPLAPAWTLGAAGPVSRALTPPLVRAGALLPTSTLRIDLHPADLRHPRHMLALERVLHRAAPRRAAVTYRQLAGV